MLLIFLLTLMFLLVLGYGIHAGLDIDCGCFGVNDPAGSALSSLRTSFIRNIGFAGCDGIYPMGKNAPEPSPKTVCLFSITIRSQPHNIVFLIDFSGALAGLVASLVLKRQRT